MYIILVEWSDGYSSLSLQLNLLLSFCEEAFLLVARNSSLLGCVIRKVNQSLNVSSILSFDQLTKIREENKKRKPRDNNHHHHHHQQQYEREAPKKYLWVKRQAQDFGASRILQRGFHFAHQTTHNTIHDYSHY